MKLSNEHKKGLVYLIRGFENKRPTWYYVEVKDNIKLALLNKKSETEEDSVPLEEYGEIIESGWGEHPPAEIIKKIEEQYS